MSAFNVERITHVHHWNETLFSIKTTRDPALRFHNGHFVMIGMEVEGKPLMRAYSIASANHEEQLEFLSIKVQDGPLTSRLQHVREGDFLLVSKKPVGTLIVDDLLPGKNLYLLATGTGLAPFMSIIKDPVIYERFEKVILVHGVRQVSEFAYHDYITNDLLEHEYLGDAIREQLIYYPTATREPFRNNGRLTDLIKNGKLAADIGLPQLSPERDRVMLCGSPAMLTDCCQMLDGMGFVVSPQIGSAGDYVIERAFVAR
jgi:ferredoxin--NADP+ reductase